MSWKARRTVCCRQSTCLYLYDCSRLVYVAREVSGWLRAGSCECSWWRGSLARTCQAKSRETAAAAAIGTELARASQSPELRVLLSRAAVLLLLDEQVARTLKHHHHRRLTPPRPPTPTLLLLDSPISTSSPPPAPSTAFDYLYPIATCAQSQHTRLQYCTDLPHAVHARFT